jgi:hypothetical protein
MVMDFVFCGRCQINEFRELTISRKAFYSTMMIQAGIRRFGVQSQQRMLSVVQAVARDDLPLRIQSGAPRVRSAAAMRCPNALYYQAKLSNREFGFTTLASCIGLPVYTSPRRENETPCSTKNCVTPSYRINVILEGKSLSEEDDDG